MGWLKGLRVEVDERLEGGVDESLEGGVDERL